MLAELVDHVIGVDPDRDWITAAVLDANTTGVIATAKFAANNDGYDEAVEWADTHTAAGDRGWVVEGSGSYGRGLTAALGRAGEWVIEFDRPHQRPTKDGAKTDELDAVRAAREALGRRQLHSPRTHDGHREALRVHTVTRAGVVRARTAAINELKALVLTSPDELRSNLRGLTTLALIKRCAAFRTTTKRPIAEQCVRNTMRVIARRVRQFNDEIEVHDAAMKQLVDETESPPGWSIWLSMPTTKRSRSASPRRWHGRTESPRIIARVGSLFKPGMSRPEGMPTTSSRPFCAGGATASARHQQCRRPTCRRVVGLRRLRCCGSMLMTRWPAFRPRSTGFVQSRSDRRSRANACQGCARRADVPARTATGLLPAPETTKTQTRGNVL